MSMSNQEEPLRPKKRTGWPLKTLVEILPVLIALTTFFSYTTIQGVSAVELITPLTTILDAVPLWIAILMIGISMVGILGMGWLIYIFTRSPVSADGSNEESV